MMWVWDVKKRCALVTRSCITWFRVWGFECGAWWGLGIGVWGLGFGVWSLGFGVRGAGFSVRVLWFRDQGCRSRFQRDASGVLGVEFEVRRLGFGVRVRGWGFGVWCYVHVVWGLEFNVEGFRV